MRALVLRAPIYEPNSHGGTARALAIACHKAGIPTRIANCSSGLWANFPLKLRREETEILTELEKTPVKPYEYWLVQHLVPNQFVYDPFAYKNVGYATFETDSIPQEWLVPMQAMDEVWCASLFNIRTYGAAGVKKQLRLLPHGIDPDIFNEAKPEGLFDMGLPQDAVKFGCCFDWTPRKNGLSVIQAFLHQFRDRTDAVLALKVYFKGENQINSLRNAIKGLREELKVGEFPKVYVCNEIIPDWYMSSFYHQIDCLVSVSHGEGFNKPVLEAMACGIPSIVTGWGGHMDFCNSSNSMWIANCPLGPVQQEQVMACGDIYANQNWSFPSLFDIAQNMEWFASFRDTDFIKRIKENCLLTARSFAWSNVAQHVKEIIEHEGD